MTRKSRQTQAPRHPRAYTSKLFETRWSSEAVIPSLPLRSRAVILSAAKDLRLARREILRGVYPGAKRRAQDDTSHLAGSFPIKPTRVETAPGRPCPRRIGLPRPCMVGIGDPVLIGIKLRRCYTPTPATLATLATIPLLPCNSFTGNVP